MRQSASALRRSRSSSFLRDGPNTFFSASRMTMKPSAATHRPGSISSGTLIPSSGKLSRLAASPPKPISYRRRDLQNLTPQSLQFNRATAHSEETTPMFGVKIVREDGKTDWGSLRAVMYCLLATWILGVRLLGLDPFDDLMSGGVTLATWIDLLCLWGVYLFCWHVMFPNRPKISI